MNVMKEPNTEQQEVMASVIQHILCELTNVLNNVYEQKTLINADIEPQVFMHNLIVNIIIKIQNIFIVPCSGSDVNLALQEIKYSMDHISARVNYIWREGLKKYKHENPIH